MDEKFYTLSEAAAELHATYSTVRSWIAAGRLRAVTAQHPIMITGPVISASELDRFRREELVAPRARIKRRPKTK